MVGVEQSTCINNVLSECRLFWQRQSIYNSYQVHPTCLLRWIELHRAHLGPWKSWRCQRAKLTQKPLELSSQGVSPPSPSGCQLHCTEWGPPQGADQRWKPVSLTLKPLDKNHLIFGGWNHHHHAIQCQEPLWFWRPANNLHLCWWNQFHSWVFWK